MFSQRESLFEGQVKFTDEQLALEPVVIYEQITYLDWGDYVSEPIQVDPFLFWRKTRISWVIVIMQLLGHSSIGMTAGYAHGTNSVMQTAVDKLAQPRGEVVSFERKVG